MEKLIAQMLDTFEISDILDFNDIPDVAILEALIDAGYIDELDLRDQLDEALEEYPIEDFDEDD